MTGLANGYDVMGTNLWLCVRPECVIAFKLSGREYSSIAPVHRFEPTTYRLREACCCICGHKLAGGLEVEV